MSTTTSASRESHPNEDDDRPSRTEMRIRPTSSPPVPRETLTTTPIGMAAPMAPDLIWPSHPDICHASARPPAFLSTMPHIPSSLEGMRSHKALNGYRSLNVANDLGQNWDSRCWVCLSQSEAFPPLSP